MKLKCDTHKRRIKVVHKGKTVLHNSDGTRCDTKTWHMGPDTVNPATGYKPHTTGHISAFES